MQQRDRLYLSCNRFSVLSPEFKRSGPNKLAFYSA